MANLVSRQKTSKLDAPTGEGEGFYRSSMNDEESLLRQNPNTLPSDATPPETATATGAAASPHLKVLFRKIVLALSPGRDSDNGQGDQSGGAVGFLKDIVVGVVCGVITISILIFMDHHNAIHLQSAHNFRDSTYQLLNEPETLANLEESTDMKFITSENYNAMQLELSDIQTKIASGKEELEVQTKKAEEKQQELDPLKGEYEKLIASSNLGLDKFCGSCKWGGTTCEKRVQFMMDTYGASELSAKIHTMAGGKACTNP